MLEKILAEHYGTYGELDVILRLNDPLLYEFAFKNEKYLAYVLQDRTVYTKNGLAIVYELFVGKTTKEDVEELKCGSVSILDALGKTRAKQCVGAINNKIYPMKELMDIKELEHKLPLQETRICEGKVKF